MRGGKTRILFKCPKCAHESERGTQIGGVFSSRFTCEKCGTTAVANGYLTFSVLYAAIVLCLLILAIEVLQRFLGPETRFEYVLGVAIATVIVVIFVASKYYWKLVLRWKLGN